MPKVENALAKLDLPEKNIFIPKNMNLIT